jgi:AcrR family transcriptional regulator
MGRRPADRPLLSRSAIVGAARAMLVEQGLEGLSLRRLAQQLRVTAPALYLHVKDKRDLLQAVADAELETLIDRFHDAGADTEPLECIRRRSLAYIEYAVENPQLFGALFLRQPELTSEPWEGQQPLAAKACEVAGEPVHRAVAAGQLRAIDPTLAATTVWAVMHGVAAQLVTGPPLDPAIRDQLATTAIDAVIAGLANPA